MSGRASIIIWRLYFDEGSRKVLNCFRTKNARLNIKCIKRAHVHAYPVVEKESITENVMDLSGMRKDYTTAVSNFDVADLVSLNPIEQFKSWFEEASQPGKDPEPNAMSLATANKNGMPSVRVVLLKHFDKDGFRFFTNYESRKGRELEENPNCSLMFYWPSLYRVYLDDKFNEIDAQYEDSELLPCPEFWGGYIVRPASIEFWHGSKSRRHDRIRFRLPASGEVIDPRLAHVGQDGWVYERLGP